MTPYTIKPGLQIGILYQNKTNYHNPDQDWVQEVMLGIKPAVSKQLKLFTWAIVITYVLLASIKVHV
jgi:hypothetical protein